MKYKIIFFLLLTSCSNTSYNLKDTFTYSAKGFAHIQKNSLSEVDQNIFFVSHNKLKSGTKIRISNPSNLSFVEVIIKKKIKYEDFYKVLISESVAKKLLLDLSFPYVEVTEIKLNKSFIAKKAITENVEKNIANKAPITKISIDNLSVREKIKEIKLKNYSILVAEFYNIKSAELLKEKLATILMNSNYKLIYINKKNDNSYELLMGPYNTINKLKNDYITLNDSNFEDLDIKIND